MALADRVTAHRMTTRAKVLTFDIETRPGVYLAFSPKVRYLTRDKQMIRSSIISFAAKWYDSDEVIFESISHGNTLYRQPETVPGYKRMLKRLADLLDECDIAVGFNSIRFDEARVRGEIVRAGLREPTPFRSLDLIRTVRRLGWDYSSLAETLSALGLESKTAHQGFELWTGCLTGDAEAWSLMELYNRTDVVRTEQAMDRLRPFIKDHPNLGLWADTDQHGQQARVCPKCAGELKLIPDKHGGTAQSRYNLMACQACGARDTRGTVLNARVHTRTVR